MLPIQLSNIWVMGQRVLLTRLGSGCIAILFHNGMRQDDDNFLEIPVNEICICRSINPWECIWRIKHSAVSFVLPNLHKQMWLFCSEHCRPRPCSSVPSIHIRYHQRIYTNRISNRFQSCWYMCVLCGVISTQPLWTDIYFTYNSLIDDSISLGLQINFRNFIRIWN